MRRAIRLLLYVAWLMPMSISAATGADPASLDRAYRLMYSLDFQGAELECLRWQQQHPADPLGPASEGANLLFSEFERRGVLRAQFLVDDSSFRSSSIIAPDPNLKSRFDSTLHQAEVLARKRVSRDEGDRNALFALALVYGLKGDYTALIEKRNMACLVYTHRASEYGTRLLAIAPDYYDAYLATGISQYIVGSLVAPVRWMMRLGGFRGDKTEGIRELKLTAERGRYLAPFARILLAVAYLREHNKAEARGLLVSLRNDFPSNPLFAEEINRIDARGR